MQTSSPWAEDAVFYHVYPLGACGAPARNDFQTADEPRLALLNPQMDRWQRMGVNALYLGPLFESTAHGYDTADYFRVDRRLGTNAQLAEMVRELHRRGIHVILDGVFNHVGRDFWAFQQLRREGESSAYRDWFRNISFDGQSPYGDPFRYEGWHGCMDLVRLNLKLPAVRKHLLEAVTRWIEEFDIDGLRLDVAEELPVDFLRELATFCRARRPDFWLLGEMIHGDYRRIANPEMLDSATNYECFKGLWSSFNERNFFEIAYALNRQFGPEGVYRELGLYNFADNHDVTRVASILKNRRHLNPLYLLLFAMPGVPSIYYGSEWGTGGLKEDGDPALRPALFSPDWHEPPPMPELEPQIAAMAHARHGSPALRHGGYRQILVQSECLVFARECAEETVLFAVNSAEQGITVELDTGMRDGELAGLLDEGPRVTIAQGRCQLTLEPCSGRLLRLIDPAR
jgi:glycosidase